MPLPRASGQRALRFLTMVPAPPHDSQDSIPTIAEISEAMTLTEPQGGRVLRRLESHHNQRDTILCLSLHVLLVFIHVALFVVISHHYEHAFTIRLDSSTSTWAPLIVGTTLQIFATAYSAILVLLTQRLALRNDLGTRQTLTAVHDKASAWLGLGSALGSLWQQTKLRAATWGVSCITLYLLCMFTLHISIQGLFHVVPYNATIPTLQSTNLTNANYTANMVSAYDILLVYDQIPTVGLLDNMVYDIVPQVPSATGNAKVNASMYEVQCMALPNVQYEDIIDDTAAPTMFFLTDGPGSAAIGIKLPYYQALYAGTISNITMCTAPNQDQTDCWAPIVIASTVSIIDSSGAGVPTSTGNPWVAMPFVEAQDVGNFIISSDGPPQQPQVLITAIQMVACAVEINDTQIDVSAMTRQPLAPPPRPSEALWAAFSWPENLTIDDPRLIAAQNTPSLSPSSGHENDVDLTIWSVLALTASDTSFNVTIAEPMLYMNPQDSPVHNLYNINPEFVTQAPAAFDTFVAEELEIAAQNRTNVTLADLNHSIGKALAAVHWYGQTQNYSGPHASNGIMQSFLSNDVPVIVPEQPQPASGVGQTTIMVLVPRYRLNLSLTSLIIGTVASTILLLLAAILVRLPSSSGKNTTTARATVDSAGLLQITWLLGHEPHIAAVATPELEALRAAGMFELATEVGEVDQERAYLYKNGTLDSGRGFESD
ncbi:uncharacterized protein PHACADRAFT_208510 [Phanerochaete carnosa HHB-10118-sp]|uniref:Uncharacterized protein n=1 Tax=Phanerochaete carnosa (strain HHB-10118-sp) TaxID=650164 RepID=K5W7M2_PHACS|nr:uncharacterized protein PHACADRAFT_208510 [Phanerochaete carnosa HHB-10118-sp]EKM54969.1 hypothetical protein PHACADRAFT_208510 [Phanerochaete carnosa HHB-10118-sp]